MYSVTITILEGNKSERENIVKWHGPLNWFASNWISWTSEWNGLQESKDQWIGEGIEGCEENNEMQIKPELS